MSKAVWGVVDFAGGVVAGFAFGMVAALLLAPREGDATRARISTSAEDALNKPLEVVDDLQARVNRAIEEGRQAAAQARAEMEATAGIGRSRKSAETRSADAGESDEDSGAGKGLATGPVAAGGPAQS
jgi:gas vesicle protein